MDDGEGEEAGSDVVEHDAGAFGQGFELPDGPGLGDIEGPEEQEAHGGVLPVRRNGDEGDEHTRGLIHDDEAGILAAGLARDDGRGRDADERHDQRGHGGGDGEGQRRGRESVNGEVPKERRGSGPIGARPGFQQAGAEECAQHPGPARLADDSIR